MKSPSCESLKLFWLAERILLTKMWKIVLICKIHKNDVIRLKLCQKVDLKILYKCVQYEHSPSFRTYVIEEKQFYDVISLWSVNT